jgi:SSS family solute:Na+ symporter
MTAHLGLLIAYTLALVAVGLWLKRLVRGSGDFFVAGRKLSPLLLFATVLAANIGAGSTIGATGLAYRDGVSAWWWNGSAGIGSLILAFWVGPRIWRLASQHGFYTAGDFLEHRYGPTVRGVIASLIWLGTLFILAGQLIAGAAVFEAAAGLPRWLGAAIGGVVMTATIAAGGLLGSAWINLVQLVVLLTGFLIAVPMVLASVGGLSSAPTSSLPPAFFDVWYSSGAGSGWTLALLLIPAFFISPGLLQKAYGADSERTVRLGIGLNGLALLLFAFAPVVLGMAARIAHPGMTNPDLVLPTLLVRDLPPWIGALLLAAVFSAEVSTCDTILFMLATSLAQDLYRRFINPQASDRRILEVARWATVAGGIAGVVLAILLASIIQALSIFYALLGVSLFVPIVAGLIGRRGGAPEALASILAGTTMLLAATIATDGRGFGWVTPNLVGIVAAALAFTLVLIARRRPQVV